eukprot:71835_1
MAVNLKRNKCMSTKKFVATNNSSKFSYIIRLISLFVIIIVGGFGKSFIRYYESNIWFGNPFTSTDKHNNQNLITLHAIQGIIWTISASIQVLLGSLYKYKQYHKFIGKYVFPINIILFLSSAFFILFYEFMDKTVHPTSIHLNVGAGLFILTWTVLGYYYIFINKQIEKHQDCMIATFIASFVPGLYRLLRYIFQLFYWLFISTNICDDVNVFPYIFCTGIMMAIVSRFILRKRLNFDNLHNLLYVSGYVVTLIYPILTMDINFNPCRHINIDHKL